MVPQPRCCCFWQHRYESEFRNMTFNRIEHSELQNKFCRLGSYDCRLAFDRKYLLNVIRSYNRNPGHGLYPVRLINWSTVL